MLFFWVDIFFCIFFFFLAFSVTCLDISIIQSRVTSPHQPRSLHLQMAMNEQEMSHHAYTERKRKQNATNSISMTRSHPSCHMHDKKQKKKKQSNPQIDKIVMGINGVMELLVGSSVIDTGDDTIGLSIAGGIESSISKIIWFPLSNDTGKSVNFNAVKWITPNICIQGYWVSMKYEQLHVPASNFTVLVSELESDFDTEYILPESLTNWTSDPSNCCPYSLLYTNSVISIQNIYCQNH
eukprot:677821_1